MNDILLSRIGTLKLCVINSPKNEDYYGHSDKRAHIVASLFDYRPPTQRIVFTCYKLLKWAGKVLQNVEGVVNGHPVFPRGVDGLWGLRTCSLRLICLSPNLQKPTSVFQQWLWTCHKLRWILEVFLGRNKSRLAPPCRNDKVSYPIGHLPFPRPKEKVKSQGTDGAEWQDDWLSLYSKRKPFRRWFRKHPAGRRLGGLNAGGTKAVHLSLNVIVCFIS